GEHCTATGLVLGTPTIADNCTVFSATNGAVEPFALGSFPTRRSSDLFWNVVGFFEQIVTVTDDEDPTITAPLAVSVSADAGLCTATGVALGTPTIADNCTGFSATNDAVEPFALGNTTVTWTVTDGSGN